VTELGAAAFETVDYVLTLSSGSNTILLIDTGSSGPNIDSLEILR